MDGFDKFACVFLLALVCLVLFLIHGEGEEKIACRNIGGVIMAGKCYEAKSLRILPL